MWNGTTKASKLTSSNFFFFFSRFELKPFYVAENKIIIVIIAPRSLEVRSQPDVWLHILSIIIICLTNHFTSALADSVSASLFFIFFFLPSIEISFSILTERVYEAWWIVHYVLSFLQGNTYIFHVVSSLTQPQSHPNITYYTAYISHCSADFYAALMWNATLRWWGFGFFLRRNFVRRFQPFWCGDTFRRGFFHPYFFLLFSASPSSHSDRVTRFSQQIYLERSCCYDCGFLNRQQNFFFDIEISLLSLLLFALWNSREFFFWLSSLFLFYCVMMKRWEFFNFPKIFFSPLTLYSHERPVHVPELDDCRCWTECEVDWVGFFRCNIGEH